MTPTYRNIFAVLCKYLSQVNAQLALERALSRVDLTPASVGDNHISSLLPYLERSLNLFVERTRLPHVLAELSRQHVTTVIEEKLITLASEADLTEARIQARQMCQDIGVPSLTRQKVITLVSELARNIVLYAQQGRVQLSPFLEPRKKIVVRATDSGPGISNLTQIMAGEYTSKTGLGMGLRGCKRLADRFQIDTGDWGTRIEAEIQI